MLSYNISTIVKIFTYDSIDNKLYYLFNPNNRLKASEHNHCVEYTFRTRLSDSIKRQTDCFVPFGTSKDFRQLRQFQSFRSIKEMPIYKKWFFTLNIAINFIDISPWAKILSITGILLVQFLFWFFAYSLYKNRYQDKTTRILCSFLYGLGMSLLAILAFLAIYWLCYSIIIISYNEWIKIVLSSIFGVFSAIICMCVVYKNAFYSFKEYLAINGYETMGKDIIAAITNAFKNLRKYTKLCAAFIVGIIAFLLIVNSYVNGKERRETYLKEFKKYDSTAKIPAIIDELEKQHASPFYGFFTDSLKAIKQRTDSSKTLVNITSRYLQSLTNEHNNIIADDSWSRIDAISYDGNEFCLVIKSNDKYQYLYLNLATEKLDTLSQHSLSNSMCTSFSPSSKTILTWHDKRLYSYDTQNNNLREVNNGFNGFIDEIVMSDDTTYYFISDLILYKGHTTSEILPKKLHTQPIWKDNLIFVEPNIIAADGIESGLIIYDIDKDSIIFTSNHNSSLHPIDIISQQAITRVGILNLINDSIVYNEYNRHRFILNNMLLDAEADENKKAIVFKNQNGEEVNRIYGDNILYNSFLSKDGNRFINDGIVYRFTKDAEFEVPPLNDYDRKLFDLK